MIAITLLVLEIELPQNVPQGQLMWINHHRLFALIRRADNTVVAINLLLLLGVSWVSFPTAVLAEHLRGPDQRAAAILYSSTFLVIGIVFNILWQYAMRSGQTDEPAHPITRQYSFAPLFYGILLMVGIFNATACLILSALLAVYFALSPRFAPRNYD